MRALFLVLVLGCGAAPAASPGTTPVEPSANVNRHETDAAPADLVDAARFDGLWTLTHDGATWCTLELRAGPAGDLVAGVPRFDPSGSWTEFRVVRVKLDHASGTLELLGDYEGFDETVTVTLRLVGAELLGEASGSTYGMPSVVRGTRGP